MRITEASKVAFETSKHLIDLKGKKYLPTYARIMAFREKHERGSISTEIVSLDPLIVKATVYDGDGMVLATGHAGAVDTGKQVWSGRAVEKAETASIGRALGAAGFGTQYALDENDASEAETGHLADSPTGNGRKPQYPAGDLRNRETAQTFIEYWRREGLKDADVLAALGVEKLSQWTSGQANADKRVKDFLAGKVIDNAVDATNGKSRITDISQI